MRVLLLMTALAQILSAMADYPCVCNYDVENAVHAGMDNQSAILGYLYEFDCKETVTISSPMNGWVPVAFKHEIGYMMASNQLQATTCLGDPSTEDFVTTTISAAATAASTTMAPISSSTIMDSTIEMTTTAAPSPSAITWGFISGHLELCPAEVVHSAYLGQGIVAQYGGSCYMVMTSRVSWTHAETNCKAKHGHLVSITSADEQNFLYSMLVTNFNHSVWIGLHDRKTEETFEWVSGEGLAYTNWAPDRLTTNHNSEDCVYLVPSNKGQWDDIPCGGTNVFTEPFGVKHSYMCEFAVDPTLTTYAPAVAGSHTNDGNAFLCPVAIRRHAEQYSGILAQYKENCYELLPRYRYTWSHGEQVCRSHGGYLAHISDADEQDFIQQFMMRHSPDKPAWIGLNDISHEGNFTWVSGDAVQYLNWAPNHVGNFLDPSREDCVAFYPNMTGMWDDVECGRSGIFGGDSGETHPPLCQYHTVVAGTIIG